MITTIDRKAMQHLRVELEKHLPAIAKQIGVNLELGRGSYTHTDGSFKLLVTPLSPEGNAVSKDEIDFKKYAVSYGFKAEDWGAPFKFRGENYTISGLRPKSWKRPLIGTASNGKQYKFEANTVLRGMGREPKDGLTQHAPPWHGEDGMESGFDPED